MNDDKKNKNDHPWPGDPGYKGGETTTTVIDMDGHAYEVKTVKDAYGNVVYASKRKKMFDIF